MRRKFTYLLFTVMISSIQFLNAQEQYRSVTSGNWGSVSTWEYFDGFTLNWEPAFAVPNASADVITIRNTHTVTVAATQSADQVVVASGGTLAIAAAFTIADGAGTDLTVQSGGTINWSAGNVAFTASATLSNSGTINATGNNDFTGTSGTFSNLSGGIFNKNTGTGNTTLAVNISNAGTINVNAGTFRNNSSSTTITNSGTITIASGAIFNVPNATGVTLSTGTTITGSGLFRINGATSLNMALTIPSTLEYEVGGEITGSGSIALNGVLTWTANAIRVPVTIATTGVLDIEGSTNRTLGAAFTNNGVINWTVDADLVMSSGSSISNNASGTFNYLASGSRQMRQSSGTPTFSNAGTFLKTGSGSTLTITDMSSTNTGTIRGVGTIVLSGGTFNGANGTLVPGTSAGLLTISAGTVASGTEFDIEILNTGGPGVGHDQIAFTGSATNLTGTVLNIADDNAAPIGVYTIMTDAAGFTGTFATVNKPSNYADPVIAGNTVTIEKLTILPVSWGEFFLKLNNNKVQLNWETLTEINTSHFVVERSVDGKAYQAIGTVAAKGESLFSVKYEFSDANPVAGAINSYRLKQVDLDGTFDYSETRVIRLKENDAAAYITIYGNPVSNNVLRLGVMADDIHILLNDMTGKVVKSMRLRAGVHNIYLGDLGAGTYHLSVQQRGNVVAAEKIVKY